MQINLNPTPYSQPGPSANEAAASDNMRSADAAIDQAMDLGVGFNQANQAAMSALAGDISEGGLGSLSPAVSLGINSEVARGRSARGEPIGVTIADLMDLNAVDPVTGDYAINNPNPQMGTPSYNLAINASNTAADLNPSIATAIGVVAGLMGPAGSAISSFANINRGGSSLALDQPGAEIGIGNTGPVAAQSTGIMGLLADQLGITDQVAPVTAPISNAIQDARGAVTGFLENTVGALGTGIGNVVGSLGLPGLDQPTAPPGQTNAEDVGGGPLPVPAPTPEVPPSIANTATLAPIPEVPGIDLTRLPLNPPIQFSPFPPTTGIV